MNAKKVFEKMANSNLVIEALEIPSGETFFSLKWGQSSIASNVYGIPRKQQIKALKWADENEKEALSILGIIK